MLIAHVADTHLGYAQYGLEERELDYYDAFSEVISRAIEEHVEVLVHSGDVFHSPRPPIRALKRFQEELIRLRDAGVRVYAIPGSHDMMRRKGLTPLLLYEHLGLRMLCKKRPFDEYKGVLFCGFEYVPRHFADALREMLPVLASKAKAYAKSVLMLHQALDIAFPLAYELRLAELPTCFSYYAMGHIHRVISREYGRGVLAYPGSTEIVDRGEISFYWREGKGFYLVDMSGDQPEIEFVRLQRVRPQVVKEVEAARIRECLGELEAAAASMQGKKPILHLRIKGSASRAALEAVIERLQRLYLRVRVSQVHKAGAGEDEVIEYATANIEELIHRRVASPDVAAFALKLLKLLSLGDEEEAVAEAEKFFKSGKWRGAKP